MNAVVIVAAAEASNWLTGQVAQQSTCEPSATQSDWLAQISKHETCALVDVQLVHVVHVRVVVVVVLVGEEKGHVSLACLNLAQCK